MSQAVSRLLQWLIHSHVFIGLCALALAAFSSQVIIGLRLSPEFGALAFTGTVALYSIHRYGQSRVYGKISELRSQTLARYRNTYVSVFIIFATLSLFNFILNFRHEWIWFIPPGILAFLYIMPWNAQWKRIRDLPFIKIWMISACWVWVTVILPVVYINEYYLFKSILWWHALEIGCLLIAITLPFDLRDEIADKAVGVKTFVTEFGMEKARYLSLVFLLISSLTTMYLFLFLNVSTEISWSMWITQFIAMLLIMQSSYTRPDYYYSILLDGVLILPWGFYMFLTYP